MTTRHSTGAGLAPVIQLRSARHALPTKRGYVRLPDEVRDRTTAELLALKAAGRLDDAAYARLHRATGASVSALEKLLLSAVRNAAAGGPAVAAARTGHTSRLDITDDVLACHIGRDVTSAHAHAMTRGLIPACHRTTYRRALSHVVSDGVLDGLRYGQRVLPQQWVYLDRRENPLMDQFTIDLFFPRVRTIRADGTTVVPVWVGVRERSRGLLLTWKLFGRAALDGDDETGDPTSGPTSESVLALLGEAMRGWTRDGVYCGGVPRALRCDREALFLTDEVREALMTLGIEVDPTNSYSSWENGAHERMHQVIRREALQGLPASNNGPRNRAKKLHFADATVTFDELDDRLTRWALSYNFERPNSAVGGLTPFDSWTERVEAGDTVRRPSNAELAPLSLPAGTAKKQKNGITLPGSGGIAYASPALVGVRNGTVFALGRWLTDDRHVEAFDPVSGAYVATLERCADMSAATEAAILHARHTERQTIANGLAEARRRAAIENGPTPVRPIAADGEPAGTDEEPPVSDRHATDATVLPRDDNGVTGGDVDETPRATAGERTAARRSSRRQPAPAPQPMAQPVNTFAARLQQASRTGETDDPCPA